MESTRGQQEMPAFAGIFVLAALPHVTTSGAEVATVFMNDRGVATFRAVFAGHGA